MAEAALDDVFIDDITLPATDGYPLAATLVSAPRGQAPRRPDQFGDRRAAQDLPGFAGYLAGRGCAVLTYDYRGTGRLQAEGADRLQPAEIAGRLQGLDVGLGGAGCHRRGGLDARALQGRCRSPMSAIPSAARRWDCCRTTPRCRARCLIAAQAGYWKLMTRAGTLSRLCPAEFRRPPPHPRARLSRRARWALAWTCRKTCFCNGSAGS